MVLSDEELIERYQSKEVAGKPGAEAEELLGRYSSRVAGWCVRFTGDREAALDLAQDILLKAYRNLATFRSDAKFSTWLYSIARNHCMNHLRSRSSRPIDVAEPLDVDPADDGGGDVLSRLERADDMQQLRRIMAQTLDETEAKVMMLHYGEETPLETVTTMLGLQNQSGAKAYIVSARRKLNAAVRRWRAGTSSR